LKFRQSVESQLLVRLVLRLEAAVLHQHLH
jgi:hypothetical protein